MIRSYGVRPYGVRSYGVRPYGVRPCYFRSYGMEGLFMMDAFAKRRWPCSYSFPGSNKQNQKYYTLFVN